MLRAAPYEVLATWVAMVMNAPCGAKKPKRPVATSTPHLRLKSRSPSSGRGGFVMEANAFFAFFSFWLKNPVAGLNSIVTTGS